MSLIDVTIIEGDPDAGATRAGCVQTDHIYYAHAIAPRGSESRFVIVYENGSRVYCTGDPQVVLTP